MREEDEGRKKPKTDSEMIGNRIRNSQQEVTFPGQSEESPM